MLVERLLATIRAEFPAIEPGLRCPARPELGDFTTPAPARAAANLDGPEAAGAPAAPELAERLAERLAADPAVERTAVTAPGFVGLRLTPAGLVEILIGLTVDPTTGPDGMGDPDGGAIPEELRWLETTLRGAPAYEVEPAGRATAVPDVLTGRVERALVCGLAELDLLRRTRPEAVSGVARRVLRLADRSEALRSVLPMGDADPDRTHRTALLLAAATGRVCAGLPELPG